MGKIVCLNMKKVKLLASLLLVIITAILIYLKIRYHIIGLYLKFRLYILIYIIIFIFAHELLHGLGFRMLCKTPWENIKFGFHKTHRVFYCSCEELHHDRNKLIGVILLPTIVMGRLTLFITHYCQNLLWTWVSAFVFSGGAGDIYMAYDVLKYPKDYKFIDHPTEPGYIVYKNCGGIVNKDIER